VTDNETATLTVTSNVATITENSASAAVTFTVSRNSADLTQPLTVNVLSGTPGRMTISDATVTIPANASSVTFTGSAVDNNLIDGNASVVVTTSATGFVNGTATVTVTDNEDFCTDGHGKHNVGLRRRLERMLSPTRFLGTRQMYHNHSP
jgi:hypothetical protein